MEEVTPAPAAPEVANATMVFTFEEQLTSSVVLYGLSLLCIIVGGVRSSNFVKRLIQKKKLIESSITMREAKKFPITASMILFGLYLFFNPDRLSWSYISERLPPAAVEVLEPHVQTAEVYYYKYMTIDAPKEPVYDKFLRKLPEKAAPVVDEFFQTVIFPVWAYVPTPTKQHGKTFLLVLLCFEGCVSLAALLKPFFSFFLRLLPIGNYRPKLNLPYMISIVEGNKEMDAGDIEDAKKKDFNYLLKMEWDTHDAVAISFCSLVGISHLYRRHWITNNILGVAFSIFGIENLHLSNFKAGTILLAGLFVYDIFWVFATDVMTSVAKGIDAPILLQFPQDIYRNGWFEANKYSMLGLGDIVIPGLFIALLRRFDQRITEPEPHAGDKKKGGSQAAPKKWRIYFYLTIVAYGAGLLLTMVVMQHFKLWNYNEDHLVEAEHRRKEEEAKKKN